MQVMLCVFLGGGLGALARYLLVNLVLSNGTIMRIPFAILSVNLLGSLLIGLLAGFFSRESSASLLQPFLIVGFLGGFTTFSSFSLENFDLIRDGLPWAALANILASVVGGILLAALGFSLTYRSA